jgi:hypothetical protein
VRGDYPGVLKTFLIHSGFFVHPPLSHINGAAFISSWTYRLSRITFDRSGCDLCSALVMQVMGHSSMVCSPYKQQS